MLSTDSRVRKSMILSGVRACHHFSNCRARCFLLLQDTLRPYKSEWQSCPTSLVLVYQETWTKALCKFQLPARHSEQPESSGCLVYRLPWRWYLSLNVQYWHFLPSRPPWWICRRSFVIICRKMWPSEISPHCGIKLKEKAQRHTSILGSTHCLHKYKMHTISGLANY